MNKSAFVPADILIPATADMREWSVVACDQFTSEPEYWDRVGKMTEGKLSTFHMIFPEAYLNDVSVIDRAPVVNGVMESYLSAGVFEELKNSFVYVERNTSAGLRCGLVGAVDLEAYDYSHGSDSLVRASEWTVAERLPARMLIRDGAVLELPHVMVLIDDVEKTVVEPLADKKSSMRKLYDFDLMEGGGHIRGWQVTGETLDGVMDALTGLAQRDIQLVIGDGNHSLAAAKELWEKIKLTLAPEDAENHPARYALVELNNVYDSGIVFEPIHRIVFNVDPGRLVEFAAEKYQSNEGYTVSYVIGGKVEGSLKIRGKSFGTMIDNLQEMLEEFAANNDGTLDYIHDEDAVKRLTEEEGSIGFLLPAMDKSELFKTVAGKTVFPKKSFSIGHARDKRYYLECRAIK